MTGAGIGEGMSKQDYVQKYLEDILVDAWRKGVDGKGIDVAEEADEARLHLTKWGVVIDKGKQWDYIRGGYYRAIEPLIGGANNGKTQE